MNPASDSDLPVLSADFPTSAWGLERLLSHSLELRSHHRYALHPIEAAVQHLRAQAHGPCDEGHGELRFEQAEAHYRAGAQGLRLSEVPQLPQQIRELSRLSAVDRAGRKAIREWAEAIPLAPTARPIAAQGNALGTGPQTIRSPERAV